jgi:amicoumacin kinase
LIPVPEIILEKLSRAFGAQASALSYFSGGREESDGVIYAYPYQQRRRLLKIMAVPQEKEQNGLFQLEERMRFAQFAGENGVRMVYPQLSSQRRLYETERDESQLWIAYTMEVAPGHTPAKEDFTPEFCRNWGQIVGKLHQLAQQYPTWNSSVNPATGLVALTWQEEWQDFYDWAVDEEVRDKWVSLREQLEMLPIQPDSFGFIHNDPHIYNLLVAGNQITLLDFDVANHHWFIADISIACQSVLFDVSGGMHLPVYDRAKLVEFLRFFMEGYRREFTLKSEWLDYLDLFFAYRRILLFIVMNGWIKSKPDLHASWKKMILEQPQVLGTVSQEI